MSELHATAFRLNATDLQIIDTVRRRYGLANRTEALRFLLRWWDAQKFGQKLVTRNK